MKRLITLLATALILTATSASGQVNEIRFHDDGTLKILQFTDFHYIYEENSSAPAIDNIHKLLEAEKPDLIVVTGDMIYGKPAKESIETVINALSSHRIPFCTMFGNHDDEQGMSRQDLYRLICKTPWCINAPIEQCADPTHPDYIVEVKSAGDNSTAAVLYCLDSRAYSEVQGVEGYAAFTFDQIAWYREKSKAYKAANEGTPLPSIAFFHIPMPEYEYAITNKYVSSFGTHGEWIGCSYLNSGMFSSMREMGDIYATFCGHEHDNDYAVDYYGICLCYGRYSGGSTVYNHLPNGGRIITLHEGKRSFESYIRLRSGEKILEFSYPEDFDRSRSKFQNW